MTRTQLTLLALFALAASASASRIADAAYMVEPRTGGKGFATFALGGDTSPAGTSTTGSAAVGLTAALGSIFGGASTVADTYIYSYTPGTNAVPASVSGPVPVLFRLTSLSTIGDAF